MMRAQYIGNGSLTAQIPPLFAAAIRALQLRNADAGALRSLRDDEWRELLAMMDRTRLTLPFANQRHSGLPTWVSERLEKNLADTARHWQPVQVAYREAAAMLDGNGIEYVVLKGFSLAPDFVPHPELRRQNDIDLYVPRTHIASAVRVLEEIGYAASCSEESARDADHVPTLVRFGAWKPCGNIYDPQMPPAIEIHFCLWNERVYSIAVPEVEEFWKRRILRTCGELNFPALRKVDHLGYFAMHILRSIFSAESPVHHVRELATFLDRRAGDDAFWKEWGAMHSARLRKMEAIAFSLAAAWFSCSLSSAVQEEIDSLCPAVQAWIETCGVAPLEITFRRTRDGRLLQYLLAETSEPRKKILWKALSPGRIPGPAKAASFTTYPSQFRAGNAVSNYLDYALYLAGRAWINGWAVLRLLAHTCVVASRTSQ